MELTSIIFLDIDGVLNHSIRNDTEYAQRQFDPRARDYRNWIPYCVSNLDVICEISQAKVVISSSWRVINKDISWWNEQFKLAGACSIVVVGITPRSHNAYRGREIMEYLTEHGNNISNYVIIDDESDFYPFMPFVKIDPYIGLGKNAALKALRILEQNEFPDYETVIPEIKRGRLD